MTTSAGQGRLRPRLADIGFAGGLRHGPRSLGLAVAAGLGWGAFMALADGTVFAAAVPEVQHWMLATMGLGERLAFAARGVVFDEIVLRFGVLAALVWALARVRGRTDDATWWVAILIVALAVYPLSAWSYFSALDWSGLTVAREVLLHGGAGALWGWLCWRHGWLAGLAGHLAAHLSLQPLLG